MLQRKQSNNSHGMAKLTQKRRSQSKPQPGKGSRASKGVPLPVASGGKIFWPE